MTTRELLFFKTVADEKNISRAAKKLFIAQPSLSQAIKRIEESMGTSFFNRTVNGLTLTYAGERFYVMATQMLNMYNNFEIEISDINDLRTGRVNMGITSHLGACILPQILTRFWDLFPNIELNVSEVTSSLQEEQLLQGKIEFSLMHTPTKDTCNPAIHYESVSDDPFIIAAPPNSHLIEYSVPSRKPDGLPVLDLKYLAEERFIMGHKQQRICQISTSLLKKANIRQPNVVLEISNLETVLRCVSAGLGITLIPLQYADTIHVEPKPLFFSIPEEYNAIWTLCVATINNYYLPKADLLFIRLLKEMFSDAPPAKTYSLT